MPEISTAWLALIGALLGGTGLKFLEHWLNRPKVEADTAADLRAELRGDVKELRAEVNRVQQELDKWKQLYYDLLDKFYQYKIHRKESHGE